MHRLKTRKKGKAPVEEEVPVVPSLPFLSKKKQQAPAPEKPQVDIDAALPSTDDFRTSLLMPNLAQRFSILKMEQAAAAAALEAEKKANEKKGDQNEMLYQYPSQQFGSSLADIAETASINGSIACTVRSDDGRPSEDGSVMNRPRGGEGNILFGGRQKVYRVPNKGLRGTSSMDDLQPEGSMRGGRTFYEDDLPESITRPKAVDDEHLSLSSARNTGSHEAEQTEYNKNRFTSSSTNSMPNTNTTRFSTAATSISSQHGHTAAPTSVPQSPTASKPRRPLYEQALDQQLQEQKMTAMGRLERLASMRRAGATSPTPRASGR
ncbi:hypothetical protein EX30DRAFT_220264 [Ascodesmis nigricans]|uniref:Uncharacterized protein n=1 Tax=Ascodesmis nigricans TaxID=341454 RepID=A0A4V3SJ14_9PEZI|nr:hypothetical protein EX30DRAFT_220264 [Ascodesmis nigricans]